MSPEDPLKNGDPASRQGLFSDARSSASAEDSRVPPHMPEQPPSEEQVEAGRQALDSFERLRRAASGDRVVDLTDGEDLVRVIELEDLLSRTEPHEASGPPPGTPETIKPGTASYLEGATLEGLRDASSHVRLRSLTRLRPHGRDAPLVAVAALLRDPAPDVRREAIAVLREAEDDAALLLLLDAVHDPLESVRRPAREALRTGGSTWFSDRLRQELAVPARRAAAERALLDRGELGPTPWSYSPAAEPTREDLEEGQAIARFMDDLSHPSPDRRRVAADRLGARRVAEAVGPLIERLQDVDRGVRRKAAQALGRIGDRDAGEALRRAHTAEPDPSVVITIGNSLRKLGLVGPRD